MPDPTGPRPGGPDGRLAQALVELMGWAEEPGLLDVYARADDAATEPPTGRNTAAHRRLVRLLKQDRRAEPAWWRGVAEAWQQRGLTRLAWRCAEHARELAVQGAPVDWDDLTALARLSAQARSESMPVLRPAAPWAMAAPDAAERVARLAVVLGTDTSWGDRWPNQLSPQDRIAWALPRSRGKFFAAVAEAFYELGEYRIVVEQTLVELSIHGLSSWNAERRELLVWAGRSLLRLGDRTSAYACFRLAVGPEVERPMPNSDSELKREDEFFEMAKRGLAGSSDAKRGLSTDSGEYQAFGDGVRLAQWLLSNGLEGYLPQFTDRLRKGSLRAHPELLWRQQSWVAIQGGWFRPPARPAARALGAGALNGPPRMMNGRNAVEDLMRRHPYSAAAAAKPPDRPFERSRAAERGTSAGRPGTAVPIGISTAGGPAVQHVAAGSRVLMLGPPFDNALLHAVAAHLAEDGWKAVLVEPARAAPAASGRWHQVRPTGRTTAPVSEWVREVAASADVRSKVRDCLRTRLPVCLDPAAEDCIEPLVKALEDASKGESLWSAKRDAILAFAASTVDTAAKMTYDRVHDLRRAVVLMEHVEAAALAIGEALATRWSKPTSSGTNGGAAVRLEVPADDALVAALRVAICAGSLLEAERAAAGAAAAANAAAIQAEEEFLAKPLQVTRRADQLDEDIIRAAEAATDRPSPPRVTQTEPVADRKVMNSQNPWLTNGVLPRAEPSNICVLVDGDIEAVWDAVGGWLCQSEQPQALLAKTSVPSARALATTRRFEELLLGGLAPDRTDLLEIAFGAFLGGLTADTPVSSAARLRLSDGTQDGARFIVWPSEPAGWGIR